MDSNHSSVNNDPWTIRLEGFAAILEAVGKTKYQTKPQMKDTPPAVDPDSSADNDDGWTVVKNKHGTKFAARIAPAAKPPEIQAEETPEPSTLGGTCSPPSPSPTEAVVELEYDGEDEYSGDEVVHDNDDDDEADAEADACDDATDEYCHEGFRADYDALVVEENKMMDQVVYDFVNRSKWPYCTRHKRECKRKGQRKKTVERRHQRSDKEALN